MTPNQKQILRSNLLRQLETVRRGLPLDTLRAGALQGGFNVPALTVAEQLDWLVGKGYAAEARADYSDVVQIWKITEAGIEFLDR